MNWHRKCVEPVKRKHGSLRPEWQHHRFEIKGGISFREAMIRDMSAPNVLLRGENGGIFFRDIPIRLGAIGDNWRDVARCANIETSA